MGVAAPPPPAGGILLMVRLLPWLGHLEPSGIRLRPERRCPEQQCRLREEVHDGRSHPALRAILWLARPDAVPPNGRPRPRRGFGPGDLCPRGGGTTQQPSALAVRRRPEPGP